MSYVFVYIYYDLEIHHMVFRSTASVCTRDGALSIVHLSYQLLLYYYVILLSTDLSKARLGSNRLIIT